MLTERSTAVTSLVLANVPETGRFLAKLVFFVFVSVCMVNVADKFHMIRSGNDRGRNVTQRRHLQLV